MASVSRSEIALSARGWHRLLQATCMAAASLAAVLPACGPLRSTTTSSRFSQRGGGIVCCSLPAWRRHRLLQSYLHAVRFVLLLRAAASLSEGVSIVCCRLPAWRRHRLLQFYLHAVRFALLLRAAASLSEGWHRIHLASHRELVDFSTAFAPTPTTFSSSEEATASIVSIQSNPARPTCQLNRAPARTLHSYSIATHRRTVSMRQLCNARAASRPTVNQ